MTLVKGQSGNPRGRPRGIIDKRHQFYDMKAQLIKRGYDPIAAHIELAINGDSADIRYKANRDIIERILPTLKSIEHKTDDTQHKDLLELRKKMLDMQSNHIKEF